MALIPRSARGKARIGRGPFAGVRSHEMGLVYLETEQAGAKPTHAHVAIFNGEGDGITTEVRGHSHRIDGLVLEAAADGHTHELGETRVEPIAYRHYRAVIANAKGDKCEH